MLFSTSGKWFWLNYTNYHIVNIQQPLCWKRLCLTATYLSNNVMVHSVKDQLVQICLSGFLPNRLKTTNRCVQSRPCCRKKITACPSCWARWILGSRGASIEWRRTAATARRTPARGCRASHQLIQPSHPKTPSRCLLRKKTHTVRADYRATTGAISHVNLEKY